MKRIPRTFVEKISSGDYSVHTAIEIDAPADDVVWSTLTDNMDWNSLFRYIDGEVDERMMSTVKQESPNALVQAHPPTPRATRTAFRASQKTQPVCGAAGDPPAGLQGAFDRV